MSKRAGPSSTTKVKRTRFESAEPDEDGLLEEDLPENGAKTRAREKKKVKDTEGYGSDSSNDEEGVVPSRRPGKQDEGDGDGDGDMDMFGEAPEPEEKKSENSKSKKEFMDLNDFEGQEFADEGSDSDSEVEAEKLTRKQGLDGPMGFDITPFNMKSEMDEGRFTTDGEVYQANEKDPGENHDQWLEGLDKDAVKKARRAQRERERIEKEAEERDLGGKERENEMLAQAVELLERGETVLEGLQRLGKEVEDKRKGIGKMSWAEKQKERKLAEDTPFNKLSELVSSLTSFGHLDVYSLTKESISRMLPQSQTQAQTQPNSTSSSNSQGQPSNIPIPNKQYEYRFSMNYVKSLPEAQRPIEREVFGPFSLIQLQTWRNTGFFGGPACENVEMRVVGSNKWASWQDVVI